MWKEQLNLLEDKSRRLFALKRIRFYARLLHAKASDWKTHPDPIDPVLPIYFPTQS